MPLELKKAMWLGLAMVGIFSILRAAKAESSYHPTTQGGNFGLGLEFGDPGDWGVVGKLWFDRTNALQFGLKFNGGDSAIAQVDYLWHDFKVIHMKDTAGEMPLYIGAGGNLWLRDKTEIAGRVPLGISYIFDKKNVPVDIYLQAVPTVWFYRGGDTTFKIYGELGAHYYF